MEISLAETTLLLSISYVLDFNPFAWHGFCSLYGYMEAKHYKKGQGMFNKKLLICLIVLSLGVLSVAGSASANGDYNNYNNNYGNYNNDYGKNYTFQISLVDVVEDEDNAGFLGKPSWYQWIYKVEVVKGESKGYALSHFTIELEDCFKDSLLGAIEETSGANGKGYYAEDNLLALEGSEKRKYEVSTGKDGNSGTWGIKWDIKDSSPNDLDEIGEIEYFWFSAPTNDAIENKTYVKAGQDKAIAYLDTPACPDCSTNPVVPEPATMLLMSSGIGMAFLRRRFQI